jgi:energy-converting hydrogenase A subunit M
MDMDMHMDTDMNTAIELTLEQDLNLRTFSDLVQKMSREQAQAFLIEQHRLMMIQKTMYQGILKHEWKLDSDFAAR